MRSKLSKRFLDFFPRNLYIIFLTYFLFKVSFCYYLQRGRIWKVAIKWLLTFWSSLLPVQINKKVLIKHSTSYFLYTLLGLVFFFFFYSRVFKIIFFLFCSFLIPCPVLKYVVWRRYIAWRSTHFFCFNIGYMRSIWLVLKEKGFLRSDSE